LRTRAAVEAMIAAGATRIGTSSGLAIIGASAHGEAPY
jgi:deoxyribose-phosphate aldolase